MTNKEEEKSLPDRQGLLEKGWYVVSKLLLQSPRGAGEAVWRLFAISVISWLMFVFWLVWKHPEVITKRLQEEDSVELVAEKFKEEPETEVQVMQLIGRFIVHDNPDEMAMINWITQTEIMKVWSDPDNLDDWPINTDGVISLNMKEAVANMIFRQCWSGNFAKEGEVWLICGMSNKRNVWGYIVAHWANEEDMTPHAREHLDLLTSRVERMVFD